MKIELAKMIKDMTFEEMFEFSSGLFNDYKSAIDDGQSFDQYSIAQGLIGTANLVLKTEIKVATS